MMIVLFLIFCINWALSKDNSLLSPLVFDAHFYVNTYGDLLLEHIVDKESAQKHWIEKGIKEGRYGTSFFHAPSYLKLNEEVMSLCGKNNTCAIIHWICTGYQQGLDAMINGVDGMFMLSNVQNTVHYSVYTPRFGGAVHSCMYNNREIANAYDHGKEIQFSITLGHGNCFRPNEAGGKYDNVKPSTHSVLKHMNVNMSLAWESYLDTSVKSAFWMSPDTSDPKCGKALNQEHISNWTISKTIQIEIFVNRWPYRILERVSRWWFKSVAPMNASTFELEMPRMYANGDLTKIYSYNVMYQKLTDITDLKKNGTSDDPIVLSTEDGSLAVSGYIPVGSYAYFNLLSEETWAATSSGWSVITQLEDVREGDDIELISYVVVGTLKEVLDDLNTLGGLLEDELL